MYGDLFHVLVVCARGKKDSNIQALSSFSFHLS